MIVGLLQISLIPSLSIQYTGLYFDNIFHRNKCQCNIHMYCPDFRGNSKRRVNYVFQESTGKLFSCVIIKTSNKPSIWHTESKQMQFPYLANQIIFYATQKNNNSTWFPTCQTFISRRLLINILLNTKRVEQTTLGQNVWTCNLCEFGNIMQNFAFSLAANVIPL